MRDRYVDFVENEVDTAVIVNMLQLFTETQTSKKVDPILILRRVLSQLEGTYALSIIDTDTGELYIARCGSILHYDNKGNYSTNPGTGYKELTNELRSGTKQECSTLVHHFYFYEDILFFSY